MHTINFLFLLPFLLAGAFLVAALILLAVVPLRMQKNTAACSVAVNARIVNVIRSTYSGVDKPYGSKMYAPIYEFIFNGSVHSVAPNIYTSRMPNIGEIRTLMIDPKNPERFYDPSTRGRTRMITTVVGIAMLVSGALSLTVGLFIVFAASTF